MRSYGPKKRTALDRRVQLVTFLASARSLDGITAEMCARFTGADMKTCEYELTMARARAEARGVM